MCNKQNILLNKCRGFSLIELMVSMAIGVFLMAGVFVIFTNSNKSQRFVEGDVKMLNNARFALEVISYDLRHAGIYGRIVDGDNLAPFAVAVPGECIAGGWVSNVKEPARAYNDINQYAATCTADYGGGDVIEARYALADTAAALDPNILYVNGDVNTAQFIVGGIPVVNADDPLNYVAVANAYYVSNWSDVVGDGVPSLRIASLQQGPVVVNSLLLSGVQDLQIQFGLDSNDDGVVDSYVNPDAVVNWGLVRTAQVWVVVRSLESYYDLDTSVTFNNAPFAVGGQVAYVNDGFRRVMVSAVVNLRNYQEL